MIKEAAVLKKPHGKELQVASGLQPAKSSGSQPYSHEEMNSAHILMLGTDSSPLKPPEELSALTFISSL